jgi:hypothetical protein
LDERPTASKEQRLVRNIKDVSSSLFGTKHSPRIKPFCQKH